MSKKMQSEQEVSRLRDGLEKILLMVKGHKEPGHECLECVIQSYAESALALKPDSEKEQKR